MKTRFYLFIAIVFLAIGGVFTLFQWRNYKEAVAQSFFITEGIIDPSVLLEGYSDTNAPLRRHEKPPKALKFSFEDKQVHWFIEKDTFLENELNQRVSLPEFTGSPVAFIRLLVRVSGVPIRTFGKKMRMIGPTLTLADSELDFDSTIHVASRTASIREHIAASIPPSYARHAVRICKAGEVFELLFVGKPRDAPANTSQRVAEGNPTSTNLLTGVSDEYYELYSYPNDKAKN